MSILEIEAAITELSPDQMKELMTWMEEHYSALWDQQIAHDLEAGRLNALLSEVENEYEAGLSRPL
jgi:hypothetical protein